jgi:hypothetical protein
MATIRDKPGHIAASDSSRTSYKPLFCAAGYRGEVWTTVHSIQVIENEGHIEMRVEQVYRQVSKWPTLSRIVPYPLLK